MADSKNKKHIELCSEILIPDENGKTRALSQAENRKPVRIPSATKSKETVEIILEDSKIKTTNKKKKEAKGDDDSR